jgi:hypothetical protein
MNTLSSSRASSVIHLQGVRNVRTSAKNVHCEERLGGIIFIIRSCFDRSEEVICANLLHKGPDELIFLSWFRNLVDVDEPRISAAQASYIEVFGDTKALADVDFRVAPVCGKGASTVALPKDLGGFLAPLDVRASDLANVVRLEAP